MVVEAAAFTPLFALAVLASIVAKYFVDGSQGGGNTHSSSPSPRKYPAPTPVRTTHQGEPIPPAAPRGPPEDREIMYDNIQQMEMWDEAVIAEEERKNHGLKDVHDALGKIKKIKDKQRFSQE